MEEMQLKAKTWRMLRFVSFPFVGWLPPPLKIGAPLKRVGGNADKQKEHLLKSNKSNYLLQENMHNLVCSAFFSASSGKHNSND